MKGDPGFRLLNALVAHSMVEGVSVEVASRLFSVSVNDVGRAHDLIVLENFAPAEHVLLERSPGLLALVPSIAKGQVARTLTLTTKERQGTIRSANSLCLSPIMFEVLYAYVMNSATKSEVAEALFLSTNTVKTHIYRARRFVLPHLERYQGFGLNERAIVSLEVLRTRPSILLDREPPTPHLPQLGLKAVNDA